MRNENQTNICIPVIDVHAVWTYLCSNYE